MARMGGGRDPDMHESIEGWAQVGMVPWPWLATSAASRLGVEGLRGFESFEAGFLFFLDHC